MKPRSDDEAAVYEANRLSRWMDAEGECEAKWHPSCSQDAGMRFHAHHVLQRRHGGQDDVDNLRYVCEACHHRIHARPREARARGLLIDPRYDQ